MKNSVSLLLKIEYDGSFFEGWQSQPNKKGIEDVIKAAFFRLYRKEIKIKGVSRTDSGVNARGQLATVILEDKPNIKELLRGLNALVGNYICIFEILRIDNTDLVHKTEKTKEYLYQIYNSSIFPALFHRYYWFVPQVLDLEKMQLAAQDLIGKKDFIAFRNKGCKAKNTVKTLKKIDWQIQKSNRATEIKIIFQGSGF